MYTSSRAAARAAARVAPIASTVTTRAFFTWGRDLARLAVATEKLAETAEKNLKIQEELLKVISGLAKAPVATEAKAETTPARPAPHAVARILENAVAATIGGAFTLGANELGAGPAIAGG